MNKTYFITGIGTDVGKSWATGWLANQFIKEGKSVITQKFIQTGNKDMSEDIEMHRKIMNLPLLPEDIEHLTAPIIFSYPASPHLAAKIDNRTINLDVIKNVSKYLTSKYDVLLIEGAGGVMVPVSENYLTIDYIKENNLPAIVVTNGKLGSISDTLLTLEALKTREIDIYSVIYNPHFDYDKTISEDAREYIKNYMANHYPETLWMEMENEVS